jgi:hypothetical protein
MSRFYDIDDANATLAELGPIPATLVQQREELVRLRDHALAHGTAGGRVAAAQDPRGRRRRGGRDCRRRPSPDAPPDEGLIDRWRPASPLDELGIALRDIPTARGLSRAVNGRQVWLCWRRDEDAIHFRHDLDSVSAAAGTHRNSSDRGATMSQPAPIPTIDVTEVDRRLREDAAVRRWMCAGRRVRRTAPGAGMFPRRSSGAMASLRTARSS